jgi:hypothetical protein
MTSKKMRTGGIVLAILATLFLSGCDFIDDHLPQVVLPKTSTPATTVACNPATQNCSGVG